MMPDFSFYDFTMQRLPKKFNYSHTITELNNWIYVDASLLLLVCILLKFGAIYLKYVQSISRIFIVLIENMWSI